MKVLFVDDEPNLLLGLQRMLWRQRAEWSMHFVNGGAEALAQLESGEFDVVVSDIRMPGMNGIDLLTQVKARWPSVARIILSGHVEQHMMLRTVGPAHQYLSKPSEANVIVETVGKAVRLRDAIANPVVRSVVSRLDALPSLPALYTEIMAELQSAEPSMRKAGEIAAKDVAMTAKALQLVNSAFFGMQQRITDPARAVMFLGADTMKGLALSAGVFSELAATSTGIDVEGLWTHCSRVAVLAKKIAAAEKAGSEVLDCASQAAFLHDIGTMIVAINLPEEHARIRERIEGAGLGQCAAEREIRGSTHAEIGGYLLGLWGLPSPLVEAVAFHHAPTSATGDTFSATTAVHVANALAGGCDGIDEAYIEGLGLTARLPAWREVCDNVLGQEARS